MYWTVAMVVTLHMYPSLVVTLLILPAISSGVELEPTFDVPMVNVTVKAGATAILPCSVKYLGLHQVVWTDQLSTLLTYEDRRIIDDERLSIERPYTKDWNLHIRGVRYRDQGIYSCQINTSPVKIKTINLNVIVPAKIITDLSSEDLAIREGDTVTLICNVTGIPMPTVTWYWHKATQDDLIKDSEFCPGTNKIGISGEVLLVHNISRYCGGTYECVAFNGVPPAVNRLIRISVEFPPEVRLPNRRIGQDLGRETILECDIAAYPQGISIWRREGAEITDSNRFRVEVYQEGEHTITLSLRIRNLEKSDFGTYTCVSSNSVGKDAESMILYDYSEYLKTTTTTSPSTTTQTTVRTTPAPRNVWIPDETRHPPSSVDGIHGKTIINFVTGKPRTRPGHNSQIHPGPPGQTLQSKTVHGQGHTNICSFSVVLLGLSAAWVYR